MQDDDYFSTFCSSVEGGNSYLLPCILSDATKRKYEETVSSTSEVASSATSEDGINGAAAGDHDINGAAKKKKRRLGPEHVQLDVLNEMQEALVTLRNAHVRLMMLLTKAKLSNRTIREKSSERAAKLKRKRLRKLTISSEPSVEETNGPVLPVAYFEIKPELAELLNLPIGTYVRRQDISSLISSYARQKKQEQAAGSSFPVSEELKKVIGEEWAAKIECGSKTFNSFTFNEIAKERQLFVRRAPVPSKKQTMEIFTAMGYDLSSTEAS